MKNLFFFNQRSNATAQAARCAYIFSLVFAMLMTLGVGEMWGANYTVYLYTGGFTNWENDNASFQIWDGSANHNMTSLGNHWYSVSWSNDGKSYTGAYIKRCASNWGSEWNSFSASISSSANVWKVTDWGAGSTFTNYNITVSAGSNGSVNRSVKAGSGIPSWTFTATPNTNYAFAGWTLSNNKATLNDATAATTYVTTASGTCTVTANFAPQWNIKGSMSNDDWSTFYALDYVSSNTFRGTITLAANTTYQFKVVDRKNDTWYGNEKAFAGQSSSLTMSKDESKNCFLHTAAAGTYTFEFNSSTKALTVTFPSVTHPSGDYIYFSNTSSWETIYGYLFGNGDGGGEYPGPELSSFTFDGKTYYYMAIGNQTKAIFGNNNDARKTADLTSISSHLGQYYEQSSTSWKDFTLSITYKDQGNVDFSGTQTDPPTTHTYGTATTLKTASKTGYTFGGWFTNSSCTGSSVSSLSATGYTSAITLYAKWTAKTYTVTLDREDGTTGDTEVEATFGSAMPSATMPTKTGYNFGGYYTSAGGSGTKYYNTDGSSAHAWDVADDATIHAKWTEKTYNVTVSSNNYSYGTIMSGKTTNQTVSAKHFTSDCAISAEALSGYRFTGWTYTGSVVIADATAANTTIKATATGATVTANFEVLPSGQLDIVAGANGQVKKESGSWGSSANYTDINTDQDLNIYAQANSGYHFDTWTKTGDGSIKTNAATGVYSLPGRGSATVTANFAANSYTVTLDKQSGSGGPANVSATYYATMPSATMPTRTGYDFQGYYGSTGGSGTKYYNSDGSSAHVWDQASAKTIYAYWTIHNYSISYSPASAPSGCTYSIKPTNADYNTTVNITITPDDAWHHVGVSVAKAGGGSVTVTQVGNVFSFTQPAANVTVTVTVTDLHTGVYMPNNHNSWSTSDPNYEFKKVLGSSPAAATISVDINKEDYSGNNYYFGGLNIYNSGSWWKNNGSNDTYMTTHNHSNWGFNTTDGNKGTFVDLPVSGNYTFTLTNYTNTSTQALSVTYPDKSFIEGNFAEAWDEDAYPLVEDGNIQSVTIPITSLSDVQFRLVSHGQLWGTSTKIVKADNSQTLSGKKMTESGGVMTIGAYLAGDYTFSYNKSTHVLTVTWPVVNQLQIYEADPTDATNTNNFNLSDAVSNVRSVSRTLNANTTYKFKIVYNSEHYTNEKTYTRGGSTSADATVQNTALSNEDGDDMYITTDYAGTYTFKFNESTKKLEIDYPEAYQIHFERGAINGGKVSSYPIATQVETSTSVTSDVTWVKAGNTVTLTAAEVKDGGNYIWYGWYSVQDPDRESPTTNRLTTSYAYTTPAITSSSNKNFYAVYFETKYWITIANSGNGSVDPNGANAFIETPTEFEATADHGWKFYNWTIPANVTAYGAYTANSNPLKVNATAAATLTANYQPRWAVGGSNLPAGSAWSGDQYQINDNYYENPASSGKYEGQKTIDLAANTQYELKIKDRKDGDWYGFASGAADVDIYYSESNSYNTLTNASGNGNVYLHSAAQGSYTFKWNEDTKKLAVAYPTSRYITTGVNDADGGSFTAVDNSSNNVYGGKYIANSANVVFTATPNTGYNFDGWYSESTCTTAYTAGTNVAFSGDGNTTMTLSSITSDMTVYAKFTPKPYTVTLSRSSTGYSTGGDASVTATYNQSLPAVTLPTAANGYAFMGYYSAADGKGTQFIDASGNWATSVTDTISDGKWVLDAGATLYAYYKKAEITTLTFTADVVGTETTDSVTVTPTISPTPVGTTIVCWEVQYSNGTALSPQPVGRSLSGNAYRFKAPTSSGTYKVEAKLRTGSSCGAGTILSTRTGSFQVAGNHTVTISYKSGSTTVASSSTVTANPLEWSDDITASDDIFGYTFSRWDAGDGVTIKDGSGEDLTTSTSATIKVKATYDGQLTAVYTQKSLIYFKNTLNWSSVYVNFYGEDYWGYNTDANKGSGNNGVTNRNIAMTRIGETDVWYYDYGAATITPSNYVSFTEDSQNGVQYFTGSVIYPARRCDDLADKASAIGFYAKTPMFVPLAGQTPKAQNSNNANYYNDGYWTTYTAGTGYTLEIYYDNDGSPTIKSIPFSSANELMPMTAVADLEASTTYRFQLKRDGDVYYGNSGTMTYASHGASIGWEMSNEATRRNDANTADEFAMCKITTNASGDYTFNLSYSGDQSNPVQYRLRIGVDYPIASGDYRLVYSDNTQTKPIKSAIVPKANDSKDTVSFFIRPKSTPVLKIQQSTVNPSTGAISWGDYSTISTYVDDSGTDALSKDSVYNICLTMDGSGAISVEKVEGYSGSYYIRTDLANSKWDNYRSSDHLMTYSEYAAKKTGSDYTHYFMGYGEAGTNVKFVVANDYAPNISDTLIVQTYRGGDGSHVDSYGNLKEGASANVRFMWDIRNNAAIRAYLAPAQNDGSKFLVLQGEASKLLDPDGNALADASGNNHGGGANAIQFTDDQNWMYEAVVKAVPGGRVKLYATFHGSTFYFYGDDDDSFTDEHAIELVGGTGEVAQLIRVVYDFKTDRLIAAWMPSDDEIDEAETVNADIMLVREHQEAGQQINLTGTGSISTNKTVYGVMRFNRYTLHNRSKEGVHAVLPAGDQKSQYERFSYFVSFPFDVKVGEIFGFGTIGRHWRLFYYDGLGRAQEGFFAERGSDNWKLIDDTDSVLHAYQGYMLQLNYIRMAYDQTGTGEIWGNNKEEVELYFPAMNAITTISLEDVVIPALSEAYKCTKDLSEVHGTSEADRRIKDSYWRCIGVPGFTSYPATASIWTNFNWTANEDELPYLYEWQMDDNKLSVVSSATFTFMPMHAYLVQNGKSFTWTNVAKPHAIIARQQQEPSYCEFRLELNNDAEAIDHTYIRLTDDEKVTTDFDFGQDLSKELSESNNLYTKVGYERLAANCLPMSDKTTIVPVGAEVASDGDYTFSIPEGTEGVGVTLIDKDRGIRTNLSAVDYTVSLEAGTYDERFVIEISPIQHMPTEVETSDIRDQKSDVRKVLIDGLLYIVRDNKVYDARGARVE